MLWCIETSPEKDSQTTLNDHFGRSNPGRLPDSTVLLGFPYPTMSTQEPRNFRKRRGPDLPRLGLTTPSLFSFFYRRPHLLGRTGRGRRKESPVSPPPTHVLSGPGPATTVTGRDTLTVDIDLGDIVRHA